jgi:hypothetical protein
VCVRHLQPFKASSSTRPCASQSQGPQGKPGNSKERQNAAPGWINVGMRDDEGGRRLRHPNVPLLSKARHIPFLLRSYTKVSHIFGGGAVRIAWELKRRFRNEAMRGAVSLIALFTSAMSPLRIFASLCEEGSNHQTITSLVTFDPAIHTSPHRAGRTKRIESNQTKCAHLRGWIDSALSREGDNARIDCG